MSEKHTEHFEPGKYEKTDRKEIPKMKRPRTLRKSRVSEVKKEESNDQKKLQEIERQLDVEGNEYKEGFNGILLTSKNVPAMAISKGNAPVIRPSEKATVQKYKDITELTPGELYFICDEREDEVLLAQMAHVDLSIGWVAKNDLEFFNTRSILTDPSGKIEKYVLSEDEKESVLYSPKDGGKEQVKTSALDTNKRRSMIVSAEIYNFYRNEGFKKLVKMSEMQKKGRLEIEKVPEYLKIIRKEIGPLPEFIDDSFLIKLEDAAALAKKSKNSRDRDNNNLHLRLQMMIAAEKYEELSMGTIGSIMTEHKVDSSERYYLVDPKLIENIGRKDK